MKAGILTLCITLAFTAFVTARIEDSSNKNAVKRNALDGIKEVQPSAGSLRRRDIKKRKERIDKEKVIIIKEYDEEELRRRRRREREREREIEIEREREARIKDEKNKRKRPEPKPKNLPATGKSSPLNNISSAKFPASGSGTFLDKLLG